MELICPAGSLPALKAAVDEGASAVYIGFRDATNARHFAGLNLTNENLPDAVQYAHQRGKKVFVAINTYPQPAGWVQWQRAVDMASDLGVDAVICADIGILEYATQRYPHLALHLSVQSSATNYEALRFYHRNFNIKRAVLPRVLSIQQVGQVAAQSPVELEVFAFGSLCIMAEGRCTLSSYVTDQSPNNCGACSPAQHVRWQETSEGLESRLNGVLVERYEAGAKAGYPVLCKGRYQVEQQVYHAIEEPTSLNTLELIPQLARMGVKAVKIEGRQRSPAYVQQVVRVWRQALDRYLSAPEQFQTNKRWNDALERVSEGSQTTLGAYSRPWQ
jgi:O2-independent ubiquinone biosynthesis protein UbiU